MRTDNKLFQFHLFNN